jgi:DNA-binding transcriptional LysR family regulator
MKNATFRQLRVFNEVARHHSFAKAARALHLTPPAVTMQVKELEAQVGLPLFERSGRQVALSTPGEYMLVYARKLLATLKDAEDAAARLRQADAGTLSIGMVSTAKYFLPRMLAEFRREHPHVDIRLAEGNREKLVALLQASEVDVAVMGRPPRELATRAEPFAAHPHVFVAAPTHPLAQAEGEIDAESLRPHAFIVREEGSGTRAAMERFLEEARVEPRLAMEMGSNETIKQAVIAGMGLSFLSLHTLELELEKGLLCVLDVRGAPVLRAWNVVHMLSKMLSPAAEAFRYFMLEHGEAHLAQRFGAHLRLTQAA